MTALVVSASLLGAAVLPATAENLHKRKQDVQHRITKADKDLDESSARLQDATRALVRAKKDLHAARVRLNDTRDQLSAAKALDAEMQARLQAAVARLEQAQADLEAGRAEVADQEKRLRSLVVSTYENGDPSLMGLSVVFSSQDPSQLAGNMDANSTVLNKESTILDRLQAAKVLLTVREQETQAAKDDVAEKRREAHENLVRMRALEVQAQQAEDEVSHLVIVRSDARGAAVKAKRADLRELQKLQAERDRIEALIRRKASRTSYSGYVDGGGILTYPVNGPVTSPFGWRVHPIWGYRSLHDGVDFGAGCGTPIRAAAAGKVISEYFQTAWGNRIIIDHGVHRGVGVATISNHLSGYAVGVGAHVRRGQVVGYVGTTGWSTGCHLHFTVLQNGVAVDPMNWF